MAPKRPREEESARSAKKQKKGFSVGPANLPEGTYKRKVQKIKKDLIHKAKLKKEYAKLQAREPTVEQKTVYYEDDTANGSGEELETAEPVPEPTLEPHPDRLRLLEDPGQEPETTSELQQHQRKKRPRPQPYKHETEFARKRREEAEAKRKAREDADRERQVKLAERERFRRTMAKARGSGPGGKRKLGRESTVLLEKVKRLLGTT